MHVNPIRAVRDFKRQLFRRSDGERILRERFARIQGRQLDLAVARTFSEKLYRRMIEVNRYGNKTFTKLSDKYQARQHIRESIGTKYLVPQIWSGLEPAELPFDGLPEKCVVKTTHGSGATFILNRGDNTAKLICQLKKSLAENFYWCSREYQYFDITPMILLQEFLDDGEPNGPLDYRIWCFNGKPEAIQVDNNSHNLNAFYTPSWQLTDCTYRSTSGIREAKRPSNLEEMLAVASTLSKPFDFVRIDLYNVKGEVLFGEFTFTPTAGYHKFQPARWDDYFGGLWH